MKLRDNLGRFTSKNKDISIHIAIAIFFLTIGMYLHNQWLNYNTWYCSNSAILQVEPISLLPTSCARSPISLPRTAPAFVEPSNDLYSWVRSLEPTTQENKTITNKIKRTFRANYREALAVATCESGLDPNAKNPNSSATGLFQIMSSVHGVSQRMLVDPDVNIAVAKKLYDEQGWTPWVSSRSCWDK